MSSFAIPCTITDAATILPTYTDQDCVPGTRHYGNEGRDSLHGPSFKEWNFAIFKNTAITERLNMQFRADLFNLPNHPNFANPFLPSYIADAALNGLTPAQSTVLIEKLARVHIRSPPPATSASATHSSEEEVRAEFNSRSSSPSRLSGPCNPKPACLCLTGCAFGVNENVN